MASDRLTIVEVGPRDGLQNEKGSIAAEVKVRFIDALREAGHRRIEATAFVSPKAIPQLADADEVMQGIGRSDDVSFLALVPNARGVERALAGGLDEWAVFTAASETFNQKNIRTSIDGSFERFEPVMEQAREHGVPVRGYVSTILHCPYEGRIAIEKTVEVARRLIGIGCHEVSLGETIGKATPGEVRELCAALASEGLLDRCAGHFHDTYGMGSANVLVALEAGVRTFDASAGGLGGCPYAPGAAGNVATEDLLFLFEGLGLATGVDLDRAVEAASIVEQALGRSLPGRTYQARRAACAI